jgi:hypothetical protein
LRLIDLINSINVDDAYTSISYLPIAVLKATYEFIVQLVTFLGSYYDALSHPIFLFKLIFVIALIIYATNEAFKIGFKTFLDFLNEDYFHYYYLKNTAKSFIIKEYYSSIIEIGFVDYYLFLLINCFFEQNELPLEIIGKLENF